ncbi:MAG: hypothetical protein IKH63_03385 [Prevotella sp.]|nr:hypothetical protein [Prevotella sp.]
MKKEGFTFDKFLRFLIWILLSLMLIVVVHDRYFFHKFVYNKAVCEVALLKKAKKSCHCSHNCRHYVDSISKPLQNKSSAEAANTNNIRQTVNVSSNSSSLSKVVEDASSLFSLMKDVDGLISANGLTFLISLIVALLITLVTDRMGNMERLSSQITNAKEETKRAYIDNENLGKEVRKSLDEAKKESEITHNAYDELQKEVQQSLKELERRIEEKNTETQKAMSGHFAHFTNYGMLLIKVESIFNLATTIGSATKYLSLPIANQKVSESLSLQVGTLCSRLSLLCDPLEDILYGRKGRIDYLLEDEKNILLTYLADAQNELENSRKTVKDNEYLYKILGDNKRMLEIIYGMIETV